jgi:DNA-binding transcriptional LysR family regulator
MCSRQPEAGFRETVLGLCRSTGFVPQVAHSASSTAAMAELVAAGLGLALVPQSATGQEHPGITYKPLATTPLVLEIAAVWRAEAMTSLLRLFLDHAIKAARPQKG